MFKVKSARRFIMNVFLLTPIEPENHPDEWLLSTVKERIILRTESEQRARQLAAQTTCIARVGALKSKTPNGSPWENKTLTSCEIYNQYEKDGKEEIIQPKELNEELKHMKKGLPGV